MEMLFQTNWQEGVIRNEVGNLTLTVDNAELTAGQAYSVDFLAKDFNNVSGYQFTLEFDASSLEFVNLESGQLANLGDSNFGLNFVEEGIVTTSWDKADAATMKDNDVIFTVTFRATSAVELSEALSISSRYTAAEAYDADLQFYGVALSFRTDEGTVSTSNEFALYQNTPNPFTTTTVVGFNLPEAGTASLTIYDVAGKTVKTYEGDFAKGYNVFEIDAAQLNGTGVLYYELVSANHKATKKMIIIE